jgi:hypothetical protein
MGPPTIHRRPSANILAVLVTLIVGVVIGVAVGRDTAPKTAAGASGGTPSPAVRGEVTWGNSSCSALSGKRLEIGMTIINYSTVPVALTAATITVPPRVLSVRGLGWTHCTRTAPSAGAVLVAPGVTAWVSGSTDLLIPCPGKPSITFSVTYLEGYQMHSLAPVPYNDDSLANLSTCG